MVTSERILTLPGAGAFASNPGLAARTGRIGARVVSGRIPWEFLRALDRGRAHTINIGTHNFMDAAQVANAPNDPVMQARLDACVFKGAVKNRASERMGSHPNVCDEPAALERTLRGAAGE